MDEPIAPQPQDPIQHGQVEPLQWLLTGLMVFFTGVVLWISIYQKEDGQTFQVMGNMLSGFGGALLMSIKGPGSKDKQ